MNTKDRELVNLVNEIKKMKDINIPSWASFVKTGVSKERVPQNEDWWEIRVSSILRKIEKFGPIGTNRLSKRYGGNKNRGVKPDKKFIGSRNITRKILQNLESLKLIKSQTIKNKFGKVLTKEGKELLNKCREEKK